MIILNNVLNIINVICQIIIAFSAIVAIIVTIKQIKSKSRVNIKVKFFVSEDIGFNSNFAQTKSREDIKHVPVLSIAIYNNGISPIFINSIGIVCVQKNKRWKKCVNGKFVAHEKNFILKPGVYQSFSLHYFEIWLDGNNQVNETDIIYVSIDYNMDKNKQYETTYNLGMVKEEWKNIIKKIKESDDEFFIQQMAKKIK